MDKKELIRRIEKFAPLETAESWDASGWLVETDKQEIDSILLALTVTDDIVNQAKEQKCDIILSHHPLFCVPIKYRNIDIYSAHTNLDMAIGGTTDTLIEKLGLQVTEIQGFVRYVEFNTNIEDLITKLKSISPNMRYTNPNNTKKLNKIAFCAGSGSEFIEEAEANGADGFVTGDLKFHTALDSKIPVFDIGHFESEIQVLKVFENLVNNDATVIYAKETSPFLH